MISTLHMLSHGPEVGKPSSHMAHGLSVGPLSTAGDQANRCIQALSWCNVSAMALGSFCYCAISWPWPILSAVGNCLDLLEVM